MKRHKEKEKEKIYFGVEFSGVISKESSPSPLLLFHCIKYLKEIKAFEEEGIFRISGNASTIEEVKKEYESAFKEGKIFKLKEEAHVVAGVMKLYFRELPSPLIPSEYYSPLVEIAKNHDRNSRITQIKETLSKLPKINRDTFLYILKFLFEISQHADKNKMNPSNLAVVWAPNLLYPSSQKLDLMNSMLESDLVNSLITDIIESISAFSDLCNASEIDKKCSILLAKAMQLKSPKETRVKSSNLSMKKPELLLSNVAMEAMEGRSQLRKISAISSSHEKELPPPFLSSNLRRSSVGGEKVPSMSDINKPPIDFRKALKPVSLKLNDQNGESSSNKEKKVKFSFSISSSSHDELSNNISPIMRKKRSQSIGSLLDEKKKTEEELLLLQEEEALRKEEEALRKEEELLKHQTDDLEENLLDELSIEESPPSYDELFSAK